MPQVVIYNREGKTAGTLELDAAIFGVKAKPAVLHEAVVAQRANARVAIAHTKTRGEISGGGKKPWKQKGTGRARHGSIRSPIWRGGGITFGPRSNRNFSKKINSKVKRQAILMALSDKVTCGTFYVLESLAADFSKTKDIAKIVRALPIVNGKTLLVLPASEKRAGRLAANIERVTPIGAGSVNVVDVLNHVNLVTTVEGIKEITKTYQTK